MTRFLLVRNYFRKKDRKIHPSSKLRWDEMNQAPSVNSSIWSFFCVVVIGAEWYNKVQSSAVQLPARNSARQDEEANRTSVHKLKIGRVFQGSNLLSWQHTWHIGPNAQSYLTCCGRRIDLMITTPWYCQQRPSAIPRLTVHYAQTTFLIWWFASKWRSLQSFMIPNVY